MEQIQAEVKVTPGKALKASPPKIKRLEQRRVDEMFGCRVTSNGIFV